MLAAVNAVAQDSYREAVKQYMTATDAFENAKSTITSMNMLFERDGQVDIDQLTKRYLDERFEDDMVSAMMVMTKALGLTETDLLETVPLFSAPQSKDLQAHMKEWMKEYAKAIYKPFIENLLEPLSQKVYKPFYTDIDPSEDIDPSKDTDAWMEKYMKRLLPDLSFEPKAEIDAAYAAKFSDVVLESAFGKMAMDAVKKKTEALPLHDYEDLEVHKAMCDWWIKKLPILLMNTAYGHLTLEDLDQAAELFNNDAYCKLINVLSSNENNKMSDVIASYMGWMTENGAKVSEDPEVRMNFLKKLLNLGD